MVKIRNKFKIDKLVSKFDDLRTQAITILLLFCANISRSPVFTALADNGNATYKPDAPTVGKDGTVTLNSKKVDMFQKIGQMIGKSQPVIGITITIIGVLCVVAGIWYLGKSSRDISRGDATGYGRAGYAMAGVLIFGVCAVVAGILVSLGILGGQDIIGK